MKYLLIGDTAGKLFVEDQIWTYKCDICNAVFEPDSKCNCIRPVVNPYENKAKLSGLYLWSEVFKQFGDGGEIAPVWRADDLEGYDVVHINYTPSNIQLPMVVKDELNKLKNSSTQLVMNVDLDASKWSPSWAYHLNIMVKELKLADVLFHTESVGAEVLSHLLSKPVSMCPHPVDVHQIVKYTSREPELIIGTIFHRYTAETMIPYIAQRNIPVRRVLFGYVAVGKEIAAANAGMYDQVIPYTNFHDYLLEVAKSAYGCDLYSGYSYGRAAIEFAALSIPAVVSNTIGSSALFPYTSVNPFDVKEAERLLNKIITDGDFQIMVRETALDECRYYSLERSHERFKTMLEDSK